MCAYADFFCVLEDQIHGSVHVQSVEFEGESAEGCTVAVVSAFVGDSGIE